MIPRAQIHHRLGEKRADIRIVRIFLPNLAHRIGISLIERRAIFRLRIGVTMAERFDQIALYRRSVCPRFACASCNSFHANSADGGGTSG